MEELKLIVSAITQLGEAGKEAFIWWLVMDKGLGFIIGISVVAAAILIVRSLIIALSYERDLRQIRDTLGIGIPGCITQGELALIHRRIAELSKKTGE